MVKAPSGVAPMARTRITTPGVAAREGKVGGSSAEAMRTASPMLAHRAAPAQEASGFKGSPQALSTSTTMPARQGAVVGSPLALPLALAEGQADAEGEARTGRESVGARDQDTVKALLMD